MGFLFLVVFISTCLVTLSINKWCCVSRAHTRLSQTHAMLIIPDAIKPQWKEQSFESFDTTNICPSVVKVVHTASNNVTIPVDKQKHTTEQERRGGGTKNACACVIRGMCVRVYVCMHLGISLCRCVYQWVGHCSVDIHLKVVSRWLHI